MTAGPILGFRGRHGFLSNFWLEDPLRPFVVELRAWGEDPPGSEGVPYVRLAGRTTEHIFQAAKVARRGPQLAAILDVEQPLDAKRMGSRQGARMPDGSLFVIELRPDWEDVKRNVMLACLRAKFKPHTELAEQLLATGCRMLVEGNTWGDTTWGAVWEGSRGWNAAGTCWARQHDGTSETLRGENWLGRLLMLVRAELDCEVAR